MPDTIIQGEPIDLGAAFLSLQRKTDEIVEDIEELSAKVEALQAQSGNTENKPTTRLDQASGSLVMYDPVEDSPLILSGQFMSHQAANPTPVMPSNI